MSGTIDPPKIIVATLTINNYRYALSNFIPHTSVVYGIDCFNDTTLVKSITGILEGEQYKEWTTDDWLDRFIKQKVEELPDVQVPIVEPDVPIIEQPIVDQVPVETIVETVPIETIVDPVPIETIVEPVPIETIVDPVTVETIVEPVTVETIVEPVPIETIVDPVPVDTAIIEPELPLETV